MTEDYEPHMIYAEGGEGGSEVTMYRSHVIMIRRDDFGEPRSVVCTTCGWQVSTDNETLAWRIWGAHVRLTRELIGSASPN